MIFFLLLIAAAGLYKLRLSRPVLTGYNEHYMDFDSTTAVKGLFILLVFLSHARGCLSTFPGPTLLHVPYFWLQGVMGQGIVVMFLFYSGYGVMESVKKKGRPYIRAMPKHRMLRTLVHFDIALLLYVLLDAAIGTLREYSPYEVLLAFTSWEDLGNNSWYIFAVLILYFATWLSFMIFGRKGNYIPALCSITVLTLVYMVVLSQVKGSWWYDTVLLYPLGMWFSLVRPSVDLAMRKHKWLWFAAAFVCAAIFFAAWMKRNGPVAFSMIRYLFMGLLILLITMKVEIRSPILLFFGKHLFEIFILHRLPLILLQHLGVTNVYVFIAGSFIVTVILAVGFKKLIHVVDRRLFPAEKAKREQPKAAK